MLLFPFLEEHQRREENSRVLLEQRLTNSMNECVETTRETAMPLINMRQDLQSRGARFERFCEMVTTQLKYQVDGIQTKPENLGVRLAHISGEQKQQAEDLEASRTRLHEAQEDLKGMLRDLARQVESFQGGAHSGSQQPENSASVIMDADATLSTCVLSCRYSCLTKLSSLRTAINGTSSSGVAWTFHLGLILSGS